MERLFSTLESAVGGVPAIALGAAFVWGVLSIVLSPCHLASIPLIVGFISDQGKLTTRRAFGIASLFAAGILVTIALIGAVTAQAGRSYRFDAARDGASAVITAYEVYDPPNARPIPTTSVQQAARQQCSFFPPEFDCGP